MIGILNVSLTLLFFLLGPFMALGPRLLLIWILLVALICGALLIHAGKNAGKKLCLRNCGLVTLALTYSAISALWSPSDHSWEMAGALAGMAACGFLMVAALPLLKEKARRAIGRAYFAGWLTGLALLLVEVFGNAPLYRMVNGLSANDLISENVIKRAVALYAIGLWPFLLFIEQKSKRWIAAAAGILFFLLSGFLTSRSALLGLMMGTSVLFFAWFQTSLARWMLMAIIAFGTIFTPPLFSILPLAPPEITGRFFDSAQHRMKIWELTARHVVEAPFFGNGIDASRGIETSVRSEAASYMPEGTQVISLHPHNIFLQIWLDGGLIGALLWAGLMLLLADRTRYLSVRAQPYALAACYCALAMLSTTYSILQAWWLAGHIVVGFLITLLAQNELSKADTSGSSAGGME